MMDLNRLKVLAFLLLILGLEQVKSQDILAIPEVAKDKKICFALYTVHENTLKLTAQFYPLRGGDQVKASLEIMQDSTWVKMAESDILYPGFTATFRIDNWDDSKPHRYRVNHQNTSFYTGLIKKNPRDKEVITVFAFTGNSTWRKIGKEYIDDDRHDIVKNIKTANPDLLFFSGDQVYDHKRHYEAWLKFGRDYGEVIANTPTICLPDDHDVGQSNLWGAEGKKSLAMHGNDGGYYMPVEYVKEVERAQTSHLPDPFDPTPVNRGIGVYYTGLTWGGIGFAIIEDRKFKTGPAGIVPQKGPRPDHYTTPDYVPEELDVKGAKLLGERQLAFLEAWGKDWHDTEMKAVLSQTIFAGGAHIHGKINARVYADLDANGWPQTGRNKALKEIRKSFALMVAGDQHLATVFHHGTDDWNDAGYSFCVPSIRNYYLRWWQPLVPGKNRAPGAAEYYGEFVDGFNNKITMLAVANPDMKDAPYNRGEGFGVIKFNKTTREITMECWPRDTDISLAEAKQYADWPITIKQTDNYSRAAKGYLPELNINLSDQVVQVINEEYKEVIYTMRIKGRTFTPKVFDDGNYTIIVGEGDRKKVLSGIKAERKPVKRINITL
jgi:phosphodiesterase/alkaline phosphatase D-like protein